MWSRHLYAWRGAREAAKDQAAGPSWAELFADRPPMPHLSVLVLGAPALYVAYRLGHMSADVVGYRLPENAPSDSAP
eukprot:gene5355-5382_t